MTEIFSALLPIVILTCGFSVAVAIVSQVQLIMIRLRWNILVAEGKVQDLPRDELIWYLMKISDQQLSEFVRSDFMKTFYGMELVAREEIRRAALKHGIRL